MTIMKLTIIIPVYNIKEYIERCVLSLGNISDTQIEILMIDDGSTDGSDIVCDKLSQTNKSVKVIHQKNMGLSEARNTGIKNASGDYIFFVDGDDYLSDGAIGYILNAINTYSDIYIIDHANIYEGIKKEIVEKKFKPNVSVMSGSEVLAMNGAVSAWSSICKRTFLYDNDLYFTPNLIHEDFEFSIRLYSLAKSVEHLSVPIYNYVCDRTGSIMNSKNIKSAIGYATSAVLTRNFIRMHSFNKKQIRIISDVVSIGFTFSTERIDLLSKESEKKIVLDFYRNNLKDIIYFLWHSNKSHKLLAILLSINVKFGVNIYKRIRNFKKV